MLGEAGFLSGMPKESLNKMIEVVKAIEPEMGYGAIMQVSQTEAKMREERIKRTKTVCTYCGVGCSYDVWTKERKILKIVPLHGRREPDFYLCQRQVRLGLCEPPGPPAEAAHPRRKQFPRNELGRGAEPGYDEAEQR